MPPRFSDEPGLSEWVRVPLDEAPVAAPLGQLSPGESAIVTEHYEVPTNSTEASPIRVELVRGALGPSDESWRMLVDGVYTKQLPPPIRVGEDHRISPETQVRPVAIAARLENEALAPASVVVVVEQRCCSTTREVDSGWAKVDAIEVQPYSVNGAVAKCVLVPYPFIAPAQGALGIVEPEKLWEDLKGQKPKGWWDNLRTSMGSSTDQQDAGQQLVAGGAEQSVLDKRPRVVLTKQLSTMLSKIREVIEATTKPREGMTIEKTIRWKLRYGGTSSMTHALLYHAICNGDPVFNQTLPPIEGAWGGQPNTTTEGGGKFTTNGGLTKGGVALVYDNVNVQHQLDEARTEVRYRVEIKEYDGRAGEPFYIGDTSGDDGRYQTFNSLLAHSVYNNCYKDIAQFDEEAVKLLSAIRGVREPKLEKKANTMLRELSYIMRTTAPCFQLSKQTKALPPATLVQRQMPQIVAPQPINFKIQVPLVLEGTFQYNVAAQKDTVLMAGVKGAGKAFKILSSLALDLTGKAFASVASGLTGAAAVAYSIPVVGPAVAVPLGTVATASWILSYMPNVIEISATAVLSAIYELLEKMYNRRALDEEAAAVGVVIRAYSIARFKAAKDISNYKKAVELTSARPTTSSVAAARGVLGSIKESLQSGRGAKWSFIQLYKYDDTLRLDGEPRSTVDTMSNKSAMLPLPPMGVLETLYETQVLRQIRVVDAISITTGLDQERAVSAMYIAARSAHQELVENIINEQSRSPFGHYVAYPIASTALVRAQQAARVLEDLYGNASETLVVASTDPVWACIRGGPDARLAMRHFAPFYSVGLESRSSAVGRKLITEFAREWVSEARRFAAERVPDLVGRLPQPKEAAQSYARVLALTPNDDHARVLPVAAMYYSTLTSSVTESQLLLKGALAFKDHSKLTPPARGMTIDDWASRRVGPQMQRAIEFGTDIHDQLTNLTLGVHTGPLWGHFYCSVGEQVGASPNATPFATDELGLRIVWLERLQGAVNRLSAGVRESGALLSPSSVSSSVLVGTMEEVSGTEDKVGLARHPLVVSSQKDSVATHFISDTAKYTTDAPSVAALEDALQPSLQAQTFVESLTHRMRCVAFNTDRMMHALSLAGTQKAKVIQVFTPDTDRLLALALALAMLDISASGLGGELAVNASGPLKYATCMDKLSKLRAQIEAALGRGCKAVSLAEACLALM